MDVVREIADVEALDGDVNKIKTFMLMSGMSASSLEDSIPEALLSTSTNSAQFVSAVKALAIANDQGVPIYKINQNNINTVLPQLQLSPDVISAIQDSINAGNIVMVSKTNINFNGWIEVGYIVIDPVTGAGAYMISTTSYGAIGFAMLSYLIPLIAVILLGSGIGGLLLCGMAIILGLLVYISSINEMINNLQDAGLNRPYVIEAIQEKSMATIAFNILSGVTAGFPAAFGTDPFIARLTTVIAVFLRTINILIRKAS